jgi:hypothetical protein
MVGREHKSRPDVMVNARGEPLAAMANITDRSCWPDELLQSSWAMKTARQLLMLFASTLFDLRGIVLLTPQTR